MKAENRAAEEATCVTCKYRDIWDGDYTCYNLKSPLCAENVDDDDSCKLWKKKEAKNGNGNIPNVW